MVQKVPAPFAKHPSRSRPRARCPRTRVRGLDCGWRCKRSDGGPHRSPRRESGDSAWQRIPCANPHNPGTLNRQLPTPREDAPVSPNGPVSPDSRPGLGLWLGTRGDDGIVPVTFFPADRGQLYIRLPLVASFSARMASAVRGPHLPEWRNWQTRKIQVLVQVTGWRFKSSLGHFRGVLRAACGQAKSSAPMGQLKHAAWLGVLAHRLSAVAASGSCGTISVGP